MAESPPSVFHMNGIKRPGTLGKTLGYWLRGQFGNAVGVDNRPQRTQAAERQGLAVQMRRDNKTQVAHFSERQFDAITVDRP